MSALAKVQRYVAALTGEAIQRANERTDASVTSLEENLLILSAQARSEAPWKTTRRKATLQEATALATIAPGVTLELVTVNTEEYEPGRAASKLLDYHAGKPAQPEGDRTLVINLLQALPPEKLREMGLSLLTEGNGNRHRP